MSKNKRDGYRIGFDLGGTKMMAKVFDSEFKTLARCRRKAKGLLGAKAGLERITELMQECLKEADISASDLVGIGMAAPGTLDLDSGVVLELPNLGWKNVPMKQHLESAFKCPVAVINDVDAGVYGEYVFGAGRNARCVLGVFPGTGIGGGCVYEGKLLRGKQNSCMEIGHMRVMPDGPLCGCGRRGCLEALASRLAISSALAAAAYRGDAPYILEHGGLDLSTIKSSVIADAIKAGNKVVENIVDSAAAWIGVAVANAVNLLAPDVIVLGGGLVEAMPEFFTGRVKKTAESLALPTYTGTFEVLPAQLGDEATALGSAAWAKASL